MVQLLLSITSPPGQSQAIIQALQWVRRKVEAQEPCLNWRLLMDPGQPETLVYLEEWASRDKLERYIASPVFNHLLSLMESAAEPPVLEFRFISHRRSLDYIQEIREKRA